MSTLARTRRKWTMEEDLTLCHAAEIQMRQGALKDWSQIASKLPNRTNKDCRKRWNRVGENIKKGAWCKEEDDALREAVSRFGLRWTRVAEAVEGRYADQCAKRWHHSLDPSLDRSEWSENEDERLFAAVKTYGQRWRVISAKEFPLRSTTAIKNRYYILARKWQSRNGPSTSSPSNQNQNQNQEQNQEQAENPRSLENDNISDDDSDSDSASSCEDLNDSHSHYLSPITDPDNSPVPTTSSSSKSSTNPPDVMVPTNQDLNISSTSSTSGTPNFIQNNTSGFDPSFGRPKNHASASQDFVMMDYPYGDLLDMEMNWASLPATSNTASLPATIPSQNPSNPMDTDPYYDGTSNLNLLDPRLTTSSLPRNPQGDEDKDLQTVSLVLIDVKPTDLYAVMDVLMKNRTKFNVENH